ncbi:uncharacterized protein METZ01_LOCUS287140, partial [marine metagenome]
RPGGDRRRQRRDRAVLLRRRAPEDVGRGCARGRPPPGAVHPVADLGAGHLRRRDAAVRGRAPGGGTLHRRQPAGPRGL